MANTVPIIGIETSELRWIRMLVTLLRHPDPTVSELTRQALLYLTDGAGTRNPVPDGPVPSGSHENAQLPPISA